MPVSLPTGIRSIRAGAFMLRFPDSVSQSASRSANQRNRMEIILACILLTVVKNPTFFNPAGTMNEISDKC